MGLTDKEFNKADRRIKALVRKWVRPIGLGWWKVSVSVYRSETEMPVTGNAQQADPQWTRAMSTHVSWAYRDAKINVNGEYALNAKDSDLENSFLHELGHIFVNEMRSLPRNADSFSNNWIEHEEHVCSALASAFEWIYRAGVDAGKKN